MAHAALEDLVHECVVGGDALRRAQAVAPHDGEQGVGVILRVAAADLCAQQGGGEVVEPALDVAGLHRSELGGGREQQRLGLGRRGAPRSLRRFRR